MSKSKQVKKRQASILLKPRTLDGNYASGDGNYAGGDGNFANVALPISVKVGAFSKSNVAAPPSFQQSITNVGFMPKAVMFWVVSTNSSLTDSHRPSFGFSDGVAYRSIGWASADAATTSDSSRVGSDGHIIRQITPGGSEAVAFRIVSFDSSGFTIEYLTNNTSSFDVYYFAIGGTDITNVKVGEFNAPTSDGNQDITSLGFAPDIVFFAGVNAAINTISSHSMAFMGAGRDNTHQFAQAWSSEDFRSSAEAARIQRTDRCVVMFQPDDSTIVEGEASYSQPLTNGFRLNWSNSPPSANPIFYLAIKGGGWDIGSFNQPAATGQQVVPTSGGFAPKAIILQSIAEPAGAGIMRHERMAIGASDSPTSRWSLWGGNTDAADPTITARGRSTTRIIRLVTEADVGANSAVNAEADLVSFASSQFTINWLTADAVARQILYVAVGNKPATTTVSKTSTHVYDNLKTVTKALTSLYHVGGEVIAGPYTQRYNVLAKVRKSVSFPYGIQSLVSKQETHRYSIGQPTELVTKQVSMPYGITNFVRASSTHIYSVDEDPTVNSRGYGKPLRPRIYIMNPEGSITYHEFSAFNPDESSIRVTQCEVTVAEGQAGEFILRVEDHNKAIDPSVVGEGNLVLIQAAKSETALNDGNHDLMLGYIRTKQVIRQDTNTLEYEFIGQGAQIRFNERITNFNYAARRLAYNSAVADQNDSSMYAMNLVKRLMQTTEHLPLGTPLEEQFTIKGVLDREPQVTDFIPAIEEELSEFSQIMDIISDTTGASWGIQIKDKKPDVYLRYHTLEHSGITIKDKSDPADDRYRTAYFVGGWNFEDSTRKEDGFTNRFFARSGSKSVSTNVVSISNISDQYTALITNTPPTESGEQPSPGTGTGGGSQTPVTTANIGTIVPLYTYPGDTWTSVANLARQYPRIKHIMIINPSSGPGGSQDQNYVNGIKNLQAAGCIVIGYVATGYAGKSESAVRAEVDKYVSWYGVDGIFWDEQNNGTGAVTYYANITNYAKNTKGLRYVSSNPGTSVPEAFFSGTSIDSFHIYESAGLPSVSGLNQAYFVNYPRSRRAVIPYGVSASDSTIRQFVRDCVNTEVAGFVYIQNDGGGNPWDTLSAYYGSTIQELDTIAGTITQGPSTGGGTTTPPPETTPTVSVPQTRDLAQSFIPQSSRLSDLVLILSRVGNPTYQDTNAGIGSVEASVVLPNSVHGHIESNKVVTTTVVDPQTNTETVVETNMPSGIPLAYFNVPFNTINSQSPTACFLNDIIYDRGSIVPGQRYWVVLFGRGQDEANTVRWHHSDNPQFEHLSAHRVPGGHNTVQQWTVFQEPAFAMSFFDTTLQFTEASDPDSIEQFKLVESTIDVSFINEEELIAKFLQTLLYFSSKPKRIYEVKQITAPDELILPGFLVNIIDTMSAHEHGGSSTEAEILEAHYDFDAGREGLGTHFVDVKPLGYVDFAFAKWKRKLARGEISIPQEGDPVIIQPPAGPGPQPPPPACPFGHHYDSTLGRCVPNDVQQPPTSPTPSDLRAPLRIFQVASVTDWIAAMGNVQAGDEIVVKNGTYNISPQSFSSKVGTVANPITIRAENAGGVILNGSGGWKFNNCQNVNWYGFNHRHTADTEESILFFNCTNCRFARCDVQLSGSTLNDWVSIRGGTGNRVDHNYFHDKSSQGRFLRTGRGGTITTNTTVEYNYFRNHSYTGGNGGEAFENGESSMSTVTFNTMCRYNLFENCRGDMEVISNKSCGNTYLRNAFVNCHGSLTLRHGHTNKVLFNYFDGSGLRVYGRDNVIARNMFTNHIGDEILTVPIYVGMGTVESPPAGSHAEYERVRDNVIILNTIHNGSAQSPNPMVNWGGTLSGTLEPVGCMFRGNVIVASSGTLFNFRNGSDAGNEFGNNDNIFWATGSAVYGNLSNIYWEQFDPLMTRGSDGVYRIASTSEATNEFPIGTFSEFVTEDLDGESTVNDTIDAGSDQFSVATAPPIPRRTPTNVGPAVM